MAEKYVVEFHSCEEMDAIEGKDIRAVMYSGSITNNETGNSADFDYVPLTGEVDFLDGWTDENDEFWSCFELIRDTAKEQNKRGFYISADNVPFIAEYIEDGMYTYRKYWTLFNTVDGYWNEWDADYMLKARPIDSTAFMNAMIAYSNRKG